MNSMIFSRDTWLQLKIPCRHLIVALNVRKKLPELSVLTGQRYQITTYQTTVGVMLIPEDHSIVNNQAVLPAKYICHAGIPKQRCIRSRGEAAGTGCVYRTSAKSVIARMDTTVQPAAFLWHNIEKSCHYLHLTLQI